LILAADVAVLDYSSLRFDFALTGRPMVFLVPDLDRYLGGVRGFLHDFPRSAPGPLVTSTADVVAELRDLRRLGAAHRDDLARFNAEFNDRQDGHAAERVVHAFFGAGSGGG
jgi:CDP-glycerol glycerophosphotransferase